MQAQFSGERLIQKHPAHVYERIRNFGVEIWYTLENLEGASRLLVEALQSFNVVGRGHFWLIDKHLLQSDLVILPRIRNSGVEAAIKTFAEDFFDAQVEDVWKDEFADNAALRVNDLVTTGSTIPTEPLRTHVRF